MDTAVHGASGLVERSMGRARLLRFLKELDAGSSPGPMTLYGTRGGFHRTAGCAWPSGAPEALQGLASRLEGSGTGFALFWSEERALAVLPAFPVERDQKMDGWDSSQLRSILATDHLLGVVLLRLGKLAVGVFQGEALLTSKTGSRYVKGRHSAGGWSQTRFQRRREKQVREMFDKTCSVVKEQFDPYRDRLDYVILGGERHTLGAFLKRCDYMKGLAPRTLQRVLNVREPGLRALESCIATVWESRLLSVE